MAKRIRQKSSSSSKSNDLAETCGMEAPPSKKRIVDSPVQRNTRINSTSSCSTISSLHSMAYENVNRSGKIIQMTLKNFMCHSNLLVVFNNRINLLVGNNGSGKSAILTAMIIGFGSKSAATSRCQNMKQLIKNGQNSASIEIQIHNHQSDGYEYEKYGDKIIVLRSFTAGGGSSYKIKNSSGQLVSSSREDLMRILMYLNIQVDNPVCVLNQDASRSFLRESDPKKRYQLFLKATQIEAIMEKLEECHVHFKSAKIQLEYHCKRLVLMKQTEKDMYEKLEQVRSVATINQKVAALKMEQAWLFVIDQELFFEEIKKTLTDSERKYEELKVTCSSKDALQQQIRENTEKFRAEQELLKLNMLREEERYTQARHGLAEKKAIQHQFQQNVQKLVNKENRLKIDIAQLNADIAERGQAGSNAVQTQRENDEKSKQNLNKEFADKSAMSANAVRDIEMMINTKIEMQTKFDALREERQNMLRTTDKLDEQIRRCDVSTKDTMLVYGEYMPRLRASIDALYNKGAFSQMPRGPIGHYVKITDEHWKVPIEGIIKGVLQSFLVADSKDRRVLQELIRKEYPQHQRHAVISCKFQHTVYNVSRGQVQPVPNSSRAIDLIHCDDPVVMNCLIDQCKVEKILLVEDERHAVKLTAGEENVPENLLRVVLSNPLSDFYPAPNYRSYSNPQRYAKFLQVNMEQRKTDLNNELQNYKNRKDELEGQLAAAMQKLKQITKTLSEKNEQKDKHDMDLQSIKSKLADLNAIEYPDGNEMEVLNKELDQLTRTLEETNVNIVVEKERVDEHKKLLAEKDREIEEIKKFVEAKEMQMRELQSQHELKHRKLSEIVVNAEHSAAQITELETDIQNLKKQYDVAMTRLDRLLTTARNRGERMAPRHTHEQIHAKLSLNERLIRAVPTTETPETLEKKYNNKKKECEHLDSMIDALKDTLSLLHKSRRTRMERVHHLKQHMSLRVKNRFNEILKLRNYTGDITINFETQRLELSVVPRDKNVENAVSNASGLSGGERSYSTVAFLLSLWSCVDFPFYFLDEYDVFTDQINRYYITTLLLNEAEKKLHRQYTFLTPQDIAGIETRDTISVHRLADPQR